MIDGLKIAWVSVASAAIGLVLFLNAPPAQDLFLEGKGDPLSNLAFWGSFYLVVILFWALPVFISARWILACFEEAPGTPSVARPFTVPGWVRRLVPPALVALSFAAILAGQLMALHNSPTINDPSRQEIIGETEKRIERTVDNCGRASEYALILAVCVVSSEPGAFATILGGYLSTGPAREYVPLAIYALGILVFFWLYFARPSKSQSFLITRLARKTVVATIAFLMVAPIVMLLTWLFGYFIAGLTGETFPYLIGAALAVLIVIVLLAWRGWDGFLWWLGTLFAIPAALLVCVAVFGFILIELKSAFGLAHLFLLPAATAIIGVLAWQGLSARPGEQTTRIGEVLLKMTGTTRSVGHDVATARVVNPIFYASLGLSLAMILACVFIDPLLVTNYFHRALLLPIILGLPVTALTYITYWSARWHAPLVPAAIGIVSAWGVLSGLFWDDFYLVHTVASDGPRPQLEDVVKRWEAANGCKRGADAGSPDACPSPIIVAAAGGASRSAFHVAGVIGTLLDEQRFSPIRGHEDRIGSATFSPDGSRIVTASDDQSIRIWDAKTGQEISSYQVENSKQIHSAAYDRDGARIVTASDDKIARIWNAATGRVVHELKGHSAAVRSAAFSPDGKLIVTASDDKTARIWDAATGQEIGRLEGHASRVNRAAFSPNAKLIVTASWDRTARVWDAQSGRLVGEPLKHSRDVNSAAFSPDGKLIVTASDDGTARVWDVATGQMTRELAGHTDWVLSAGFSPDGTRVVTASRDHTARIWDLQSGRRPIIIRGHSKSVTSAAFSPDGSRIITASEDHSARVWDSREGRRAPWDVRGNRNRAFSNRLFAISAVSGGALGAAVVYAALADSQRELRRGFEPINPPCRPDSVNDADWYGSSGEALERREPDRSWRDCLQVLVAGDFLSPVFVSLLSNDLFRIDLRGNRADVLERAWEARYARLTGQSDTGVGGSNFIIRRNRVGTLAQPVTGIRHRLQERNPNSWLPILLLNGTSVESGRRILTSDVDTWTRDPKNDVSPTVFRDTYDLHDLLERGPRPTLQIRTRSVKTVGASPDATRVVTSSTEKTPPASQQVTASAPRASDAIPPCERCDIRLSTAVTMSARFPIISPAGSIRDRAGNIVDRVVDGGYYENFGATTAEELAAALRAKPYDLKPVVLLINNEPEESQMQCIDGFGEPTISTIDTTPWFPTFSSPVDALLRTRTARGTHAAVNLCAADRERFALVRVNPDPTDSSKALSMSWWMSKHVQKRLDEELDEPANALAFEMARQKDQQ